MNEERAKRKISAILSADVKGYSRLMGEDELATIDTLKKYRERRELFDLQDETTKKIVVSLFVKLGYPETFLLLSKSTDNLEAWKLYMKGMETFLKSNKEENAKARDYGASTVGFDELQIKAYIKEQEQLQKRQDQLELDFR
jgi:hypothetical protein